MKEKGEGNGPISNNWDADHVRVVFRCWAVSKEKTIRMRGNPHKYWSDQFFDRGSTGKVLTQGIMVPSQPRAYLHRPVSDLSGHFKLMSFY